MKRLFAHKHGVPLLALLLVNFWFCRKILINFTSHVPRDQGDGAVSTWAFWYMAEAVFNFDNPFTTQDIFHPVGSRLVFHAYAPLMALIVSPFTKLFGVGIGMNIEVLLNGFLMGLGGYCLAYYLTKDRWASVFAGAAMIMLPIRIERMTAHYNLSQLQFIPFAILAALVLYRDRTWAKAVLLGLVVGLSAGADFTIIALCSLTMCVFALAKWKITFTKQMFPRLLLAGSVAIITASPVLIAAIGDVANNELDPITNWGGANQWGADPISYLLPNSYHPWASWAFDVRGRIPRIEILFPTFTVLALATFALLRVKHPEKRAFLIIIGVFFVLSLGPFLSIWGHTGGFFNYMDQPFSIPLPYLLMLDIPVLEGLRAPARFGYVVTVLLVITAAVGLAHLRTKLRSQHANLLVVGLVLLVGFETIGIDRVPFMEPATKPAPYVAIKNDPGYGAVLELPLQWGNGFDRFGDKTRDHGEFAYFATVHGQPLVGGYSARFPVKRLEELTAIPVYKQILSLQGDVSDAPIPATFTAEDLRKLGIDYVVIHRDIPTPAADYVSKLGLNVLADDGTICAYKL